MIIESLLDRALVAGVGVAALAGMLGTLVLWRRMAYVSDAMGHGALVGVVLGMIIGIHDTVSVIVVAVLFGLFLARLSRDQRLPFDAMLVVLSTGGLAGGLLLMNWLPTQQIDVFSYLFGDILSVRMSDVYLIYAVLAIEAFIIARFWRPLMRTILHPDTAEVEGVPVRQLNMLMMVMIAATVAVAIQVVGVLLITALLVLPALAARSVARTPGQMVMLSMTFAVAAAMLGVVLAGQWDTPVGPTVIVVAVAGFVVTRLLPANA